MDSIRSERQTKELEAIINGMRDGLLVIDSTLNVVALNQVARSILRWGDEIAIPYPLISSVNGQGIRELVAEAVASPNRSGWKELQFPYPVESENERRTYQAAASCITGDNGSVTKVVIILRDITEQRRLEDAKSNFLSVISHELRTPLATIKGFLTLILSGKAGPLTETQEEFLKLVKGQAESLHAMINDLVEFSGIQMQRDVLDLSPVSLYEIAKIVSARLMPLADEKKVCLVNDIPPDLPLIEGDRFRLEQVVTNLVCNALKFTPEGGAVILTGADMSDELTFSVEDTGAGIPKEELDRVFEPFYQVSRGTTRLHGGMGLGLAICKSVIERHGGRIVIRSIEGRGSVFSFFLPKRMMFQDQN